MFMLKAINSVTSKCNDAIYATHKVNGIHMKMQIDTGSAKSLMTLNDFEKNFPDVRLRKTSTMFKTYTGECVQHVGKFMADVKLHSQHRKLPLYVIETGSNPLLGRDWLKEIQLNWSEIKAVHTAEAINQHSPKLNRGIHIVQSLMVKHFSTLFSTAMGDLKHLTAKFTLKPDAVPKFVKARPDPLSMRKKVSDELDQIEA